MALEACPCGAPAEVVPDPENPNVMVRCSVQCAGEYLTQWHPTLEAAEASWNARTWGL